MIGWIYKNIFFWKNYELMKTACYLTICCSHLPLR